MQTAKENELFTRLNKFSTENILNLWNETTFTWNFYIVGFYEPVVAVHEDDVIFTKVEDTESWAIAGK